jgi:hypothetical protein
MRADGGPSTNWQQGQRELEQALADMAYEELLVQHLKQICDNYGENVVFTTLQPEFVHALQQLAAGSPDENKFMRMALHYMDMVMLIIAQPCKRNN